MVCFELCHEQVIHRFWHFPVLHRQHWTWLARRNRTIQVRTELPSISWQTNTTMAHYLAPREPGYPYASFYVKEGSFEEPNGKESVLQTSYEVDTAIFDHVHKPWKNLSHLTVYKLVWHICIHTHITSSLIGYLLFLDLLLLRYRVHAPTRTWASTTEAGLRRHKWSPVKTTTICFFS